MKKKILSLLSNSQLSHQIFELNSCKYIIINSIVSICFLLYKCIFIPLRGLGLRLFFYHNIFIAFLICVALYLYVLVTERWENLFKAHYNTFSLDSSQVNSRSTIEADVRDIADLVPDYHNKAYISIKQVKLIFAYKSYVYNTIVWLSVQ